MKSLNDTFIFQEINKGNRIFDSFNGIMRNNITITENEMQEQLVMIDKYVKSVIKKAVMEDFKAGNLKLVFAGDVSDKLPSILPFMFRITEGKLQAIIPLDSFGNRRQDGTLIMDARKLYTLMENAYLAKKFIMHEKRYINNSNLINGCSIYANIFIKPINKKFNINADRNRVNGLLFLAAKFYLINLLGMTNMEIVNNTAIRACKGENPMLIEELDNKLDIEDYKDLSTFIRAISDEKMNLGLDKLTVRGFLEGYMSMYGSTTTLGLELVPYFIHVLNSVISGSMICNQYQLEDIVDKGGARVISILFM